MGNEIPVWAFSLCLIPITSLGLLNRFYNIKESSGRFQNKLVIMYTDILRGLSHSQSQIHSTFTLHISSRCSPQSEMGTSVRQPLLSVHLGQTSHLQQSASWWDLMIYLKSLDRPVVKDVHLNYGGTDGGRRRGCGWLIFSKEQEKESEREGEWISK